MSKVFEKAYQATEQMINNYPVVYRKDGGSFFAKENPDKDPHKLDQIVSNYIKDNIVKELTAPPGTRTGGLSVFPGGEIAKDLTRAGIRGLINNETVKGLLSNLVSGGLVTDKSEGRVPANLAIYLKSLTPDALIDNKRIYDPITDKNVDNFLSSKEKEILGKQSAKQTEKAIDRFNKPTSKSRKAFGSSAAGGSVLGLYDYGSYDSSGKWQPGIPDFDGNFTVRDTWDWNRSKSYTGQPWGLTAIGKSIYDLVTGKDNYQNIAEALGQTFGPQGKDKEGIKMEFKVPAYKNPYTLMNILSDLDRPMKSTSKISVPEMLVKDNRNRYFTPNEPEHHEGLPGIGWNPQAFTNHSVEDYGVGHTEGLPGIGWDAEAFDDDTVEDYGISAQDMADAYDLKGGGKVMNKGLTSIPDNLMINGQPHKLSYITPDEAKTLKAMGGSGRKVNGIPAYYDQAEEDAYATLDADDYAAMAGVDTDTDFSSYGGADIIGGTTVKDGQISINQGNTFTPVVGGFGERDDPGEKGPEAFNQFVSREATGLEKFFGMGDKFGRIRQRQEDLERRAYNEGYENWRAGPGKYSDPDAYDAFFQANKGNMVAGSQSGKNPTSFALQQTANQNMQALAALQQQAQENLPVSEEYGLTKDMEKDTDKSMIESLQAGAIPGLTEVEGYEGLNIPVYMPGGMLSKGLDFFSSMAGIIGTGMMNNIAVNIHRDGKITAQSPENDPYFDYSKMQLGNEPQTTQKRRRVATETADATDVDEEEEFTGIKGLLAKKGKPTTTSSALDALMRERVNTLYGRNIFA